jgi:nitrite reductase/ring-hydroxylating ferredoxin subunit
MQVYLIINLKSWEKTEMENQDEFVAVLNEKELQEGKMKLVSVEGTPILLIKQEGLIFAINNRCPHMACSFSGGTLDGLVIVCPCHDWRFDLKTGKYDVEPNYELTKYDWKINDGKIWVKIEEEEE